MTLVLGLTGSIGMGKSTTAQMFADRGVPVWDADAAVHGLYARGGAGVEAIAKLAPGSVQDGTVDRGELKRLIAENPGLLRKIEAEIHPLVADDREAFIKNCRRNHEPVALVDVPLLFETAGEKQVDATAVVSTSEDLQRARVLGRPGMSQTQFEMILAKQMPDAEKKKRADFVIDTTTLDRANADVDCVLAEMMGRANARDRSRH